MIDLVEMIKVQKNKMDTDFFFILWGKRKAMEILNEKYTWSTGSQFIP